MTKRHVQKLLAFVGMMYADTKEQFIYSYSVASSKSDTNGKNAAGGSCWFYMSPKAAEIKRNRERKLREKKKNAQ